MLPRDVLHIIHEYREAFEQVERDIQLCVDKYYEIEERVTMLQTQIIETGMCEYHTNTLRLSLRHTLVEAGRILDRVLEDDGANPVQIMLLSNLENDILIDLFNVVCHPFTLYPAQF